MRLKLLLKIARKVKGMYSGSMEPAPKIISKKSTESPPQISYNLDFDNPILFAALPFRIAHYFWNGPPNEIQPFFCKNREELHHFCMQHAGYIDKITIPPVNRELDSRNIKLSPLALELLKQDVVLSIKPTYSYREIVQKIDEQRQMQIKISEAFKLSNEHEGAVFHNLLAIGFKAKKSFTQQLLEFEESETENNDPKNKPPPTH